MDSVILAQHLLKQHTGTRMVGRDIKSAFNGLDRNKCTTILGAHKKMKYWVEGSLRDRRLGIWIDRVEATTVTMSGGPPEALL